MMINNSEQGGPERSSTNSIIYLSPETIASLRQLAQRFPEIINPRLRVRPWAAKPGVEMMTIELPDQLLNIGIGPNGFLSLARQQIKTNDITCDFSQTRDERGIGQELSIHFGSKDDPLIDTALGDDIEEFFGMLFKHTTGHQDTSYGTTVSISLRMKDGKFLQWDIDIDEQPDGNRQKRQQMIFQLDKDDADNPVDQDTPIEILRLFQQFRVDAQVNQAGFPTLTVRRGKTELSAEMGGFLTRALEGIPDIVSSLDNEDPDKLAPVRTTPIIRYSLNIEQKDDDSSDDDEFNFS